MAVGFGNINIIGNIGKCKLEPGNAFLNSARLWVNTARKVPLTRGRKANRKWAGLCSIESMTFDKWEWLTS